MDSLFDRTGKVALVTGASTGLGAGMARGLAEAGADLVLVDIAEATATSERIKALGRKACMLVADLSAMTQVKDVTARAAAAFGRIDILVNNAGIIRRTPAADFTEEDWDDVMALNAKTVFFLSQGIARDMIQRKEGKIINIASLLSFSGGMTVPSYSASKGAVAQITKALANEWGRYGISNTANLRKDPERMKAISDRIPAGRWGMPEDLMGAVVFLASRASEYVNGHILVVDSGWMAR